MRAVRFLLARGVKMVAIVFAIIVVNFFLIHAAPGDPASVMAGQSGAADPQFIEQLRHQFGLDQPLFNPTLALYFFCRARRSRRLAPAAAHRRQPDRRAPTRDACC